VPFSTSPAQRKVFTCPAQTSCPSRLECSLCPAFRRLSLSGVSSRKPPESLVPCWCAVTTVCPLGNCDSPEGRNRLRATSLDSKRLLIASRRAGSIRVSDSARTPSEEPVNPASPPAARAVEFQRDRANQPGPIFPRSPGIICEMLGELSFRAAVHDIHRPHVAFRSQPFGKSGHETAPIPWEGPLRAGPLLARVAHSGMGPEARFRVSCALSSAVLYSLELLGIRGRKLCGLEGT
jgi:hypothetical protein